MRSFSKFAAVLFALMLACAGIGKNSHEAILTSLVQVADAEHYPSPSLAKKGQNDVFGLQQLSEIVVNGVNSFPVPSSKIHPNVFFDGSFSVEFHVRRIAQDYLLNSKKIYPSLTVSVIIFPFHYFL
ncbi:hypothetical protein [Cesiribacter sp. SM1]|uniref:hypothetical protein n=1 Tax=Cesiribacter sp. SM1 TaxID=2861196 RepID=UPI001CD51B2C|nr:hypothetical protein [Cesiribacter sp. SM1]